MCVYVSCYSSEQLSELHRIFVRFSCRKFPPKKCNLQFCVTLLIYELSRCSDPCYLIYEPDPCRVLFSTTIRYKKFKDGTYMSLLWRMCPKKTSKIQDNPGPSFPWSVYLMVASLTFSWAVTQHPSYGSSASTDFLSTRNYL